MTWFSMALGPILMTFGGLETGLKCDGFSGLPWDTPRSRLQGRFVVIWLIPGPHSNSQTVGVAIQHARYIMKHAGMKGYEKTRMQITKIQKIKTVTCSHYNRGSRIQDRAASFAAGYPRGRRIKKWSLDGSWIDQKMSKIVRNLSQNDLPLPPELPQVIPKTLHDH